MNLNLSGLGSARSARSAGRPASARINPITGEEMTYTSRGENRTDANTAVSNAPLSAMSTPRDMFTPRPASRPNSRPDGVPQLNLAPVCGRDDELDFTLQMDQQYKLNSPAVQSQRTSHREPVAAPPYGQQAPQQHQSAAPKGKQNVAAVKPEKKTTAWDKQPVAEDIPPPSDRHKQQYMQIKEDMKKSYQMKGQPINEESITERVEQLKLSIPAYSERGTDGETAQQEREWTAQKPYVGVAQLKKADKDHLEDEKRRFKLVETVMIDQLSRPVISDPEQNRIYSEGKGQSYRRGQKRGTVRTMHDSKISTSGTSTENLLSRRVQFGARILTRSGRDATRELTGFYFAVDNSLTVYEFRQLGKSAKALPFIKRGVYRHLHGRRMDEVYSLVDIVQGNTLMFEPRDQPLPDTVRGQEVIGLRITTVDDTAKAAIMLDGVRPSDRDDVWRRAHLPQGKDDFNDKLLLRQIQTLVREQIKKRGIHVWMGIGRQLRKAVDNADGLLNKYELEKTLIDFHITLPHQKVDDLWEVLDHKATSFLPYDEFMRGFMGDMYESRKILVRKAFSKIDSGKRGFVSIDDMRKFYNAKKHPKVKAGQCSEREVLQLFLGSFENTQTQGCVTYAEFEEYYEGLSLSVAGDEEFSNILCNAWSI